MCGFCCFFLVLLIVTQVSSSTTKVVSLYGDNVTLPCLYNFQTYGVLSFCWGRGSVPMSKCSNTILSSDKGSVWFKESSRYQVLGRMTDGDVSLTITNAQQSDAGVYGCRLEIPGWFNDHKTNIELILEEAPVEQPVTKEGTLVTTPMQELTTTSENIKVGHTRAQEEPLVAEMKTYSGFEETIKAIQGQANVCRATAVFFIPVMIILVFTVRRRFLQRKTLKQLEASAAESIYESLPLPM